MHKPVSDRAAAILEVKLEDLLCEAGAWGIVRLQRSKNGTKESSPAQRPDGLGAPPKHDREPLLAASTRRVHDYSMLVSQSELVRDMMDWFAGREDFPPPDERTVRRKVSAIWREMRSE